MYPEPTLYHAPTLYPAPTIYPGPTLYPEPTLYPGPTLYPEPTLYPAPTLYPGTTLYPEPASTALPCTPPSVSVHHHHYHFPHHFPCFNSPTLPRTTAPTLLPPMLQQPKPSPYHCHYPPTSYASTACPYPTPLPLPSYLLCFNSLPLPHTTSTTLLPPMLQQPAPTPHYCHYPPTSYASTACPYPTPLLLPSYLLCFNRLPLPHTTAPTLLPPGPMYEGFRGFHSSSWFATGS